MRGNYFVPHIEEAESRIIAQLGNIWHRWFFENDVMCNATRTGRCRLEVGKDRTNPIAKPIYYDLYDHNLDPNETKNIVSESKERLNKLMVQFNKGWKGNSVKQISI